MKCSLPVHIMLIFGLSLFPKVVKYSEVSTFGTALGEIDENATETMAAVFSSLPQRVIWKLNTGRQEFISVAST